ncbi:MAG TPA: nuclear transport factor 2 family protein [Mycobacteriales bacterium]|nr:nuclear transport factor 2 family protein [Mycobacteriales bacterium]
MSEITDTLQRWTAAQQQGDVGALEAIADEEFTLVGPLGFVLTKEQWLGQFRSGALVTHSLNQDEFLIREYGDAAIVICAQSQKAAYDKSPADGKFRLTQILVKKNSEWKLAGMHFSPIMAPPQRP